MKNALLTGCAFWLGLGIHASHAGRPYLTHDWVQPEGNLVANWSFENRLSFWQDQSDNGVNAVARDSMGHEAVSGLYGATLSGGTSYVTRSAVLGTPKIPTVPGESYTLSFYVRSSGLIEGASFPVIQEWEGRDTLRAVDSLISYRDFAIQETGDSSLPEWTLYTLNFTTKSRVSFLSAYLWWSTTSHVSATLHFDDVVLEEGSWTREQVLERRARMAYSAEFRDAQGRFLQRQTALPGFSAFLVDGITYDNARRPKTQPLSVSQYASSPEYVEDLVGASNAYHWGAFGNAKTEIEYSAEPGAHVKKIASPGDDWRLGGDHVAESGFYFVADTAIASIHGSIRYPYHEYSDNPYRLDWTRDEDGLYSLSWSNAEGLVVQTASQSGEGTWAVSRAEYYPDGTLRRVLTPLDGEGGSGSFTEVANYNAQGLLTSRYTRDRGLLKYWYNARGMLRYSQDDAQRARNSNFYTYYDYDAFGNLISTGEQTLYSISQIYTVDGSGGSVPGGKVESRGFLYGGLSRFQARTGIHPADLSPHLANIRDRSGALMAAWNRNEKNMEPGRTAADKLVADFFEYDDNGRLIRQYKYLGGMKEKRLQSATFEYDTLSRVRSRIIHEDSLLSTEVARQIFHYDPLGRISAVEGAAGDTLAQYFYTTEGKLGWVWYGKFTGEGTEVAFGEHFQGWVNDISAVSYKDGKPVFRQRLGSNTRALEASGVPAVTPSHTGKITQQLYWYQTDVSNPLRVVNYDYDTLGRMIRSEYQQASPTFTWGSPDFPVSFSDVGTLDTRIAYDLNGRVRGKRSGGVSSGDSAIYTYNANSYQVDSVSGKLSAARKANAVANFKYDAAGRMVRDLSKGLTVEYSPEGLPIRFERRKNAWETVLYPLYDAFGYRVSQRAHTRRSSGQPAYWIGVQQDAESGDLYAFDNLGTALEGAQDSVNLRHPLDTLFFYLVSNEGAPPLDPDTLTIDSVRRAGVALPIRVVAMEKYSALYDSLVRERTGFLVGARHYANLEGAVLHEITETFDASGAVTSRFSAAPIFGASGSIGRKVGSEYEFYIRNHQGSVVRIVKADGSYATRPVFDYQASGEIQRIRDLAGSASERFTGKELDSVLNLFYFGARWYDAELAMWSSPDPVEEFWSPYSYVGGDFVNRIDPDGRETTCLPDEYRRSDCDVFLMPPTYVTGKRPGGSSSPVVQSPPTMPISVNAPTCYGPLCGRGGVGRPGSGSGSGSATPGPGFQAPQGVFRGENEGGGSVMDIRPQSKNRGDMNSEVKKQWTLASANEHWRNGKGEVVRVDINALDIPAFPEMPQDGRFQFRFAGKDFVSLNNALVYGTMTLEVKNGEFVSGHDYYDFDLKSAAGNRARNLSTLGGRAVAGPGTPYIIFLEGSRPIVVDPPRTSPINPWVPRFR